MNETDATFESDSEGNTKVGYVNEGVNIGGSSIEKTPGFSEAEFFVESDGKTSSKSSGSGKIPVDLPEPPSTGENPTQDGQALTVEAGDALSGFEGSGGSSSSGAPRVDEDRKGSQSGRTTTRIYNNIGELEKEVEEERKNIKEIVGNLARKCKEQQDALQGNINQAGSNHNGLATGVFGKLPPVSPVSLPVPRPAPPGSGQEPKTPPNSPLGQKVRRTYFHRNYAEAFSPQASAPLIRNASRIFEQADILASRGLFTSASQALDVADGLLGTALNPEFSETDILNNDLPDVPEGKPEGKRIRDVGVYRNYVRQQESSEETPDNDNVAPDDLADLGIDITEELSGDGLGQTIDNIIVALDIEVGLTPIASTEKGIVSLGTRLHPITGEPISDLEALDIVLDFVPIVGTAKDIISLATGTNPITNEQLSDFEKVVIASGLLLPSVLGGTAKNIVKNGIKKTSEVLQQISSKGKKSSATASKILEKSKKFEDDLTGTVWDSITENSDAYPGTAVPKSFSLEIDGSKFYVPESGSKHMADHIASPGMGATKSAVVRSQAILTSFKSSVEKAKQAGIVRDSKVRFGAWELIFKEPTATHDTFEDSIIHAVFMGKD